MSLASFSQANLTRGIEQLGVEVAPEIQHKLLLFLALLQKWNKIYNLTAIRDPQQMVSHHLLDSLAVLPYLESGRLLDVGCGAGLPGLVLALARPQASVTLIDSNSKKTSFVQQALIELDIQNVSVHCVRVEEWQPPEKFDVIISRAFAETGQFIQCSRHLLHKQGHWVAMKRKPDAELERLPPGIKVERLIELHVPGIDAARCLVILNWENRDQSA